MVGADGPQGITIPRSILFKAVGEINARDKYAVEFKLSEGRPVNFMMSAFASGYETATRSRIGNCRRLPLVVSPSLPKMVQGSKVETAEGVFLVS
jgi:hypothetical protein